MVPPSTSTKKPEKTLVIVRHAHRHKDQGDQADNGLSKKGRRQALVLADHFRKVRPSGDILIVSSPKRRCVETAEPLAALAKTRVEVRKDLDEQGPKESNRAFDERLRSFATWWREEAPAYTVACSHGDWIPRCLELLTGAHAELKKGGWAEIRGNGSTPHLVWLIQEFGDDER